MKLQEIWKMILIVLLLGSSIFLFTKLKDAKNAQDQLERSIEVINNGWQLKYNNLDSTIVTQQQVILDKDSKLAKQADTINGLKNQEAQIKIVTKTVIERDTFLLDQTVETDSATYLILPYMFSEESKWYGYKFIFTEESKLLRDHLWYRNELTVVWGQEDHGLVKNIFKKNLPIVYIEDQNPYSKIESVKNYKFEDFKTKRIRLELQLGYGITPAGMQPYAGAGLGINPF